MTLEINDSIPAPEATVKPKAKRQTRARKAIANPAKPANPAMGLLNALKFISVAQKRMGEVQSQYCFISGNWIAAACESFTIATKIQEDLSVCPHTMQFIEALSNCIDELSIVHLSETTLSVKCGLFRGLVPCVPFSSLSITAPDAPCATIDDRVKDALGNVAIVATEGAANASYACVMLQKNSAVATNGFAMLESWHGNDLPPAMLIPKQAASAIAKCGKALTKFGYSGLTATFYFEDDSFIKVNLMQEKFPEYRPLLDFPDLKPRVLPENFFQAIKIIEKFSKDGLVFITENGIRSDFTEENSSIYKVEGVAKEMMFYAKPLAQLEQHFGKADFSKGNKVFFFNGNTRGVLMAASRSNYEVPKTESYDDDIPY